MFLTKMQLNPRRRGTQKLLSSPQAMHAAVASSFAENDLGADGRVLWRTDQHSTHRVLLFIVSPDKPDLTHLVEQAGWPTTEAWHTIDYDRLLGSLNAGNRWQFRLTANPVHSARCPGWTETKPLGHITVAQQQHWLTSRADRLGFALIPSQVAPDEPDLAVIDRAVRRFGRNGTRVTLATATFEGHLQVTDPDKMRQTLTCGIGRGKAYGCGLMTLARPVKIDQP